MWTIQWLVEGKYGLIWRVPLRGAPTLEGTIRKGEYV